MAQDNDDHKKLILKANGTTAVLRALQLHPWDKEVQWSACWALSMLAENNEENQQAIVDGNGISLIVDAMRRHPSVSKVQQNA